VKDSADTSYNIFSARYWFGQLDLRPLGLVRITFGAVLVLAVLDIGPVLVDLLSDAGVMPRAALLGGIARFNRFSIMDVAGPIWVSWTIFCLAVVAAVCFTIGWHSRWASIACFLLISGLHERNLMVFDGCDNVIRVMLFWFLFMPVGARYSLDAVLRGARGAPRIDTAVAFPMRLGQVQIAWIYLNTILYKSGGIQWRNGTALHTGLGLDHLFTRTLGRLLFNQAWFTVPGTYFTILVEFLFLFLVFFPWLQPWLKAAAIVSGTLLHAGVALLMSVGNFSYLMIASYALLYEASWAEAAVGTTRRLVGHGTTTVYFDGECPLCRRTVAILKGFDYFGNLSFKDFRERGALTGLSGVGYQDLERRMHALSPAGEVKAGYVAVVQVARRLPALWILGLLGSVPGAASIGSPLYDWVADRRLRFHRCDDAACAVPKPIAPSRVTVMVPEWVRRAATALLYALLAFLMTCCIWFSLPSNPYIPIPTGATTREFPWVATRNIPIPAMPDALHGMIQELELWQAWDMFSPNPKDTDTWLKGVGQLTDGTTVDVLRGDQHGGPLPPLELGMFFSRWSKFLDNMPGADKPKLLEFGRYLCRHWNNDRPQGRAQLKTFKIYREFRQVAPIGQPPNEWKEDLLWDHTCF
jgi:predicted DCC family thiol-disulfide oxidoreductase YuxK